ncbi:MAG: c-type cytochrome [Comamonadaceae bacterium]|nr:MAG: c-type cytochrome [Comamonadaceae bacterium]
MTPRLLPSTALMLALSGLLTAAPAQADLALAQSKACMACHTIDKKRVGPAFKDIAARYAGQADASAKLAVKIRQGSRGTWGAVPMPSNPGVSEADAKKLADWLLAQK